MGNIDSTGLNTQGIIPLNYSTDPEDIILAKAVVILDDTGNIVNSFGGGGSISDGSGGTIDTSGLATAAKQPAFSTAGNPSVNVLSIQGITGGTPLPIDGSGVTQPISGTVSLTALPTGSNTIGSIANTSFGISGNLPAFSSIPTFKIDQTTPGTTNKVSIGSDGTVFVSNFPSSQLISGTVTANIGTGSLTGITNTVTIKADSLSNQTAALKVDSSATTQPVIINAGSNTIGAISNTTFASTQSGIWTVGLSAGSISQLLPSSSGAATSAKQPSFGIAGTASTDVLTIQGIANGTPLRVDGSATTQPVSFSNSIPAGSNAIGSVSVSNFPSSQPITGIVTANIGSGSLTGITNTVTIKADSLSNQANALKVDASATTQPVSIAILPSLANGSNTIGSIANTAFGINGTLPAFASIPTFKIDQSIPSTTNKVYIGTDGVVSISNFPSSQSISGTVTANIGTGSLTGITNTVTIKADSIANQANALKVDASATVQPISVSTLPLPTGAATSSLQTTGNATLSSLVALFTRPSIQYVSNTISTSGNNTIVAAPGAGLSIYITHLIVQNLSSVSDNTITLNSSPITCYAPNKGDGLSQVYPERREVMLPANTALVLTLANASACNYSIGYFIA